jgi:hypothetical protein
MSGSLAFLELVGFDRCKPDENRGITVVVGLGEECIRVAAEQRLLFRFVGGTLDA